MGNFDPSITDSSFRLKKNYERYLLEYEYKCYPEHRQQALELEKQLQMKKAAQANSDSAREAKKLLKSDPNKKTKKSTKRKSHSPNGRDIAREVNGTPKLPIVLGDLVIHNLGTVIPRAPYVTEKHVFPIGFCRFSYSY